MKTTNVVTALFLSGAFLFGLSEYATGAGRAAAGHPSTSTNAGTPASTQPAAAAVTGEAGNSYQCFVGTKDAGVVTTIVQAESENAAKVAAVKQFGTRAFGLVSVQCAPGAPAAASGGAVILSKNPQLSKIPDWPKGTGVGEPSDCNKDAEQDSLDSMRKRGETPYRCLAFEGTYGGQPWESGSGGSGLFELQLHPNSPTVWRVFKRDQTRLIALVAEFDPTGKLISSQSARSPTTLLAGAEGGGQTGAGRRMTKEGVKAAADPEWAKRRAQQNHCDPRFYPGGIASLPADCPGHINLGPPSK